MRRVFDRDGILWRVLNLLTDIFALSVMWLVCCLPLFTAGAATTALYDSVTHCVRYKEDGPYRRFLDTFRSNFKVTALSTLLWGAVSAFLFISLRYLRALGETDSAAAVAAVVYYVLMVIPLGAVCWIFPLFSRFTYGFRELNVTALKLSVGFIPRTLVMVLLAAEAGRVCARFIFPCAFVPALLMLLWSLFTEPVFAKYGGGLKKENNSEMSEDKNNPVQ